MRMLTRWIAVLAILVATPAVAEWRQVRTGHFLLTIDGSEEAAREFATRLERFDAALRRLYNVADNPDQRARPINIYALRMDQFMQSCGCSYGTLGFYDPRAEGSIIYAMYLPDVDRKAKTGGWSSQVLLLHEYSHHFMFSNFPIAYPFWFSEGFAEFNATATFEADGSVIIGAPANYRAEALRDERISIKKLLDPEHFGYVANVDLLYGRGWLLTHYLILDPHRSGQLSTYLTAMNNGAASMAAAQSAFGDLKALDAELDAYQRGRLGAPLRISPTAALGDVTVTTLSPGQGEMMAVHLLAMRGIAKDYRLGPALKAAKIARRYPDDAVVQEQSAELQFLAGRLDEAEAAVDRALALQPGMIDALDRKGLIALRRAADAKASDPAVWTAARGWFLKANHLDPNRVMPLYLYYTSFTTAKAKPTPGAIKALMRAEVLAPESTGIRMALARQMLLDDRAPAARDLLQPIAFAPHSPRDHNVQRQIIDLIDAGKLDEAKALITKGDEDDSVRSAGG
ncbi:MAG: hypothetical protein WC804_08885 [Sphingomonas sp.]|uniref:tetratricopeptide repeat protein n=1 Tax=Sphingomonas sp. TaxID=28214 RepID=UPI003569238C